MLPAEPRERRLHLVDAQDGGNDKIENAEDTGREARFDDGGPVEIAVEHECARAGSDRGNPQLPIKRDERFDRADPAVDAAAQQEELDPCRDG